MIWRLLATGTGLALGYGAVLMSSCAAVAYSWPPDAGLWTCLESASPDSIPGTLATAAVGALAAMLIALAWIPFAIRRRRALKIANLSLGENLHRVAEVGVEKIESTDAPATGQGTTPADERPQPIAATTPPDELQVRIEAIESDVSSGSMSVGEVTTQWIQLLREANDLHNSGEMPTSTFKQINTRLLELPSLVGRQHAGASVG